MGLSRGDRSALRALRVLFLVLAWLSPLAVLLIGPHYQGYSLDAPLEVRNWLVALRTTVLAVILARLALAALGWLVFKTLAELVAWMLEVEQCLLGMRQATRGCATDRTEIDQS